MHCRELKEVLFFHTALRIWKIREYNPWNFPSAKGSTGKQKGLGRSIKEFPFAEEVPGN
jgi:hypothetical protein